MASNTRPVFKHPRITADLDQEPYSITPDQILDATDMRQNVAAIMWNGIKIIIRPMISLSEFEQLATMIVNQCWNGTYYQVTQMDFAIRCGIISFYTNIILPTECEQTYSVLYSTDLYDSVLEQLNSAQIDALVEAVKIIISN